MGSTPSVVIVHDYLTQRGGAERVVLAMLETFPDAPLVTSIYAPERTYPEFGRYRVKPLMDHAPAALRRDARLALPILARLFSRHTIKDADVVLCSSSGWAHGVSSEAPKVVYCHTPARWLHEPDEYRRNQRLPARLAASVARRALRDWDMRAAASAETYVANSRFIAQRVWSVYGRDSHVLHPPPGILPDGPVREPQMIGHDFLLTIARGRRYKNTAAVIEATRRLRTPLVVVGRGANEQQPPDVIRLVDVDDATLRWLYANCRAVVAAAHEDFGLTPLEAMAFGKPVVALRARGYLDSVVEGETGFFFDRAEPDSIAAAISAVDNTAFDPDRLRDHAAKFCQERFASHLHEIVESTVEGRRTASNGLRRRQQHSTPGRITSLGDRPV